MHWSYNRHTACRGSHAGKRRRPGCRYVRICNCIGRAFYSVCNISIVVERLAEVGRMAEYDEGDSWFCGVGIVVEVPVCSRFGIWLAHLG